MTEQDTRAGRQNSTDLTIQGKIEAVLGQMAWHAVEVIGSGRTDAGVHAKGQVANFHIEEHFTEENPVLSESLSAGWHCSHCDWAVDERFHSRYAAKKKTYRYHIHMGEISDVFKRKYEYQYEKTLDVERMKEAASYLIGTHDFTSFCGNKKMKKSAVRQFTRLILLRRAMICGLITGAMDFCKIWCGSWPEHWSRLGMAEDRRRKCHRF